MKSIYPEELKLLTKWSSLLNYYSKEIGSVPQEKQLNMANHFEEVEKRYEGCKNLLKHLIVLIRKNGSTAYYEDGIYTPTKGQLFHGESFKAIKVVNPNRHQSRFMALPLEDKYYYSDITGPCMPEWEDKLWDFPFDF